MFGRKSENILVIKTDGLAAFIAAEPVFEAIREQNPLAKISLLTEQGLQRLARAAPYFDQVAAMPQLHEVEARKAFVRQLKNARFSRVFDLSGDADGKKLQAGLGPFGPKWLSASAAPRAKKGQEPSLPNLDRVLSEAGLKPDPRLPDLSWAGAARKDSANMQPSWFGVQGSYAVLLPSEDPARRWPAEHYARLAALMSQKKIMPVLAGGKELHAFGDEIANLAPEMVDLCGKTDHLQLTALAQEAMFFVSDGAEEMHLAASVGCNGVVIRRAAETSPELKGRHVVTLTAKGDLSDAQPDFVWRTLDNMGLVVEGKGAVRASIR